MVKVFNEITTIELQRCSDTLIGIHENLFKDSDIVTSLF